MYDLTSDMISNMTFETTSKMPSHMTFNMTSNLLLPMTSNWSSNMKLKLTIEMAWNQTWHGIRHDMTRYEMGDDIQQDIGNDSRWQT